MPWAKQEGYRWQLWYFLVGSHQYLTLWRILLSQGIGKGGWAPPLVCMARIHPPYPVSHPLWEGRRNVFKKQQVQLPSEDTPRSLKHIFFVECLLCLSCVYFWMSSRLKETSLKGIFSVILSPAAWYYSSLPPQPPVSGTHLSFHALSVFPGCCLLLWHGVHLSWWNHYIPVCVCVVVYWVWLDEVSLLQMIHELTPVQFWSLRTDTIYQNNGSCLCLWRPQTVKISLNNKYVNAPFNAPKNSLKINVGIY